MHTAPPLFFYLADDEEKKLVSSVAIATLILTGYQLTKPFRKVEP
jgi:hypothetical protein